MGNDRQRPPQKVIAGLYSALPYGLVDHVAYRSLSLRGKAVLAAIHRSFNGWNNGKIGVSFDEIAERIGNANHRANRAAVGECIAHGLLVLEKSWPKGSRLSWEYRLTFATTGDHKRPVPATQEFLKWRPGDAGTVIRRAQPGKKSSAITATEGAFSVSTVATEGKPSVSAIATLPVESGRSSVAAVATLIEYQGGVLEARPCEIEETSGRPISTLPIRPDCIPPERWLAAGRQAAANPAGPTADDLRERVKEHVAEYGTGSQGRLAALAGVPAGTFTKFKQGTLDLTNQARVKLASSLLRAAVAEAKRRANPPMQGKRRVA